MKTIKQILLTIAVLLFSLTANAYDFEVDGFYYNIISMEDLTVEVTKGDIEYSGDIVIPSNVTIQSRTFTVTSIEKYVFYNNRLVNSVVIPNSITVIKEDTFCQAYNLTSVTIGNSVVEIGEYAFFNCSSLLSIVIPNSVMKIGNEAFVGCSSLKDIQIEDGEETLWFGMNYLPYEGLFSDCPLETLYMGRNCNTVYAYPPFSNIEELTVLEIGVNVTFINGFSGCTSLTNITIPDGVETIGSGAFSGCTSLTNITIPDGVETIKENALKNCTGLVDVVIGSGVMNIEESAFEGCSDLVNIFFMSKTPPSVKENNFMTSQYINTTLYVPTGALELYKTADVWKDFWNIKEGVGNYFKIIYVVDDENYAMDSIVCGSEIILADEPTKEGYTFSGWSDVPKIMPAEDITIRGSFFINTYALTYIVDGEICATDSLAYGSEIVLIDEPTKEGYTFSGWSEAPETMPAEDITITGSFSVNTYTITYIVDGEVYATDELTYGSEIILRDEPTKEGYTFSGWSEAPETMPAEDITITGSFIPTENVSEVEFDANIQTTNNGIILLNANNNWVRVYTINGILVKKIDNYTGEEITLNKGVYIVSVGNKAIKIML